MGATDLTLDLSRFPARDRLNSRLVWEAVVTAGPSAYPVGGIAGLAAVFGLTEIYGVYGCLMAISGNTVDVPAVWVYSTQRLRLFVSGQEAPTGTNFSSAKGTLLFTGKG